MVDFSHLDALQGRLHRERTRLRDAKAAIGNASGKKAEKIANEIAFREREIASCEREIVGEYKFLGIDPPPASLEDLSDDDLLAELTAGE